FHRLDRYVEEQCQSLHRSSEVDADSYSDCSWDTFGQAVTHLGQPPHRHHNYSDRNSKPKRCHGRVRSCVVIPTSRLTTAPGRGSCLLTRYSNPAASSLSGAPRTALERNYPGKPRAPAGTGEYQSRLQGRD